MSDPLITRRDALQNCGIGFAAMGLGGLLCDEGLFADTNQALNPMALRTPHFAPRAKQVIHLFLNGGLSQVDSFDYKPALAKYAGQKPPGVGRDRAGAVGAALPSPFAFARYGSNGLYVSELFPNIGRHIDDFCVVNSMHTDSPEHFDARLIMNCGTVALNTPSMGSWITYGLGAETQNLPGFVALCPGDGALPEDGSTGWRSGFMPPAYHGTLIDTHEMDDVDKLVRNINNPFIGKRQQRRQFDLLRQLNERHLQQRAGDQQLEAKIQSYELAFRMQAAATDAFDLSKEPQHVQELYGNSKPGRQLLLARRLIERGVRFVQVWPYYNQPFDSHNNLTSLSNVARRCDEAFAALMIDLKQRGLLDDTLIVMCGEFGRMPTSEGNVNGMVRTGRNHNPETFNVMLAGGGVKTGQIYGASDDFGYKAVENPVHVNDLHATILHLLGLDHKRLVYRYAGRDFRLTDVHGEVVKDLVA